ncbi:MAG: HAD-IC family P-type ATPase, partial [Oscillospiraceae bacterium]|nr:HAD-IC family P-type ATPase [Oscillospiraceae bacterium]
KEELFEKAYIIEEKSEHPLARAIVEAYEDRRNTVTPQEADSPQIAELPSEIRGVETLQKDEAQCGLSSDNKNLASETFRYRALPGNGAEAEWNGSLLHAGNGNFIRTLAEVDAELSAKETACAEAGKTPLFFEENGELLGMIAVADVIKADSREAIRELRNMGLAVVMLTGDNERTANAIGAEAGVDHVIAGVLPNEKEAVIRALQNYGRVAMIGDGINDAPALARADIGIAIGAGTDVAIDSADIVLMNSTLKDAACAVRLSRATLRDIKQNLFWAFIYNIICIPLAAGAFVWEMNPMIAAAAMSLSSFTVCMNALRLNLFKLHDASRDKTRWKDTLHIDVESILKEVKTVPAINTPAEETENAAESIRGEIKAALATNKVEQQETKDLK